MGTPSLSLSLSLCVCVPTSNGSAKMAERAAIRIDVPKVDYTVYTDTLKITG